MRSVDETARTRAHKQSTSRVVESGAAETREATASRATMAIQAESGEETGTDKRETRAEVESVKHPLKGRLEELVHPGECERVSDKHGLGYMASIDYAELQLKQKQRQRRCPLCCKWKWADESCNLMREELARSEKK